MYYGTVLQVLIHTPLLRDYFLSDRHICQATAENACIVCEISKLFQVRHFGALHLGENCERNNAQENSAI